MGRPRGKLFRDCDVCPEMVLLPEAPVELGDRRLVEQVKVPVNTGTLTIHYLDWIRPVDPG